jgi:hypothetical protein
MVMTKTQRCGFTFADNPTGSCACNPNRIQKCPRARALRGGNVTIRVYDAIGRQIVELVNEYHEPGASEVTFDASSLPSGVYFYRMVTSSDVQTRKMTVLK